MSVNFFDAKCRSTTNNSLFGLCDNEDSNPAYLDFNNKSNWNASVTNSVPPKELVFIAIDNCIEIRRENGDMDNRCDCLLSYVDNIVFVELKNKGGSWISEGMNQIEVTLKNYNTNHDLSTIKHKRAFVANKRHPNFRVIDNEIKRRFWDKYRVRLNIDSEINIK